MVSRDSVMILVFSLVCCSPAFARNAPKVLSFDEALQAHPNSDSLKTPYGLAFYKDKLYAGSGEGLMEITNGVVSKIFNWDFTRNQTYTHVELPCYDVAHKLFWVITYRSGLAYYDGKTWRTVNRPRPTHGYITRIDHSEGFRWVSASNAFYFQGGGRAWSWTRSKWEELEYPPTKTNPKNPIGLLDRLVATDKRLYFVMKSEHQTSRILFRPGLERTFDRIIGDSVYYFVDGAWKTITNKASKFLAEETVGVSHKGYIRTTHDELLEITDDGIVKLTTPGDCEAIVKSPRGTLLGSFRGLGVFELNNRWEKLLDSPCHDVGRDWHVFLAAGDQAVALGIKLKDWDEAKELNAKTAVRLWISKGKEWQPVRLTAEAPE